MLKKTVFALTIMTLLTACSHIKPLKAPCTYNDRAGCGGILPLQQKVSMSSTNSVGNT